MAKKDKKKDKQDSHGVPQDAIDAVRSAIERAVGSERTREIVDEISHAAGRVKQTLEDMRVLEEVRGRRREIETLARGVAALEPGRGAKARVARPAPAAPAAT